MKFINNFRSWYRKKMIHFTRWRSLFGIDWTWPLPKVVIHERFKKQVTWSSRFLLIVGVATGALSFAAWWQGVLFAAALTLIQQFVERTIFRFTSIYVQPFPDFDFREARWRSMCFMLPTNQGSPAFVGMGFENREVGSRLFDLIRSWNYNRAEDPENNLRISFVIENDREYSVYVFPSLWRTSVSAFFGYARNLRGQHHQHQELVAQLILCRVFPGGPESTFERWRQRYQQGLPTLFAPFHYTQNGQCEPIRECHPIKKNNLRIVRRRDLARGDIEYSHGRTQMGL